MMINGILNIYKEKDYTSHDVVARMRGILRQKKVGHTGTLDPAAEGVLPVCLGKATRLCSMLEDWDKEYRAVLLLGVETDTEDMTGQVMAQAPVECGEDQVREIIESFTGAYLQVPPMYSAKKIGGRKLYELARQGVTVERKPCPVEIRSIKIEEIALPRVTFTVTCSKGTYIRSLCRDIGRKAGCGGAMESLLRTRVGSNSLDTAITLDRLQDLAGEGRLSEVLIPMDRMFSDLPAFSVKEAGEKLLYNGNPLEFSLLTGIGPEADPEKNLVIAGGETVRIYDRNHRFIGVYTSDGNKRIKPVKVFL